MKPQTIIFTLLAITATIVTGCGSGGSAYAKNITCKEVKASSKTTEVVAKAIIVDLHDRSLSLSHAVNVVNNTCDEEGAKPDDVAYSPSLRHARAAQAALQSLHASQAEEEAEEAPSEGP